MLIKFFSVRKKNGSYVQEYSYVNTKLKIQALSLGLPVERVSTHSLRHGGATFLKNLGMSTQDIMKNGTIFSPTNINIIIGVTPIGYYFYEQLRLLRSSP